MIRGVVGQCAGLVGGNERYVRGVILESDREGAVGLFPVAYGKRFRQFCQSLVAQVPQIICRLTATFTQADLFVV